MMIVAMISRPEDGLPVWVRDGIHALGLELRCQKCRTEEELLAFAQGAQIIWLTGTNPCLNEHSLPLLPDCRALFRSGSGLDSLPLQKAAELGIAVHNTPDSIAESVAEHACALLLAAVRLVPQMDRMVKRGCWERMDKEDMAPEKAFHWHLSGRVLGLIGYGNIARRVESMLAGFRLRVIHYDPYAPSSPSSLPLDALLQQSDFVSVHCPLTPQTRHLLGPRELALLKPGAILVNTARGEVVDEAALVAALQQGRLGAAALDVLSQEPPAPDHPLFALDNVILSPHIAAMSADFEHNFWSHSIAKLGELRKSLG
ncbi:MAG: hypothetical protein GX564_14285 [Oligosphaeraceae bacterium]|nr:hypothetical protein [Oligosphaeraceae bacterium]